MEKLDQFFTRYAFVSETGNAAELAKFYAPDFMAATKEAASSFQNDGKFLDWLNSVFTFNKEAGLQEMVVKIIRVGTISSHYTFATVTWGAVFASEPEEEITFDIQYILRHVEEEFQIVFYISEEDQQELMKQHGLLEQ